MNISQAQKIYKFLRSLPEDHPFWDSQYTKSQCFENCPPQTFEEWYTEEKQRNWAKHFRRDIIDEGIAKM